MSAPVHTQQQLMLNSTDVIAAVAAVPVAAVLWQIVASVLKVYQERQATAGTPGHRVRSRSKKPSTGSSGSKKQSTGSSGGKKQSTGSSKRPAGVEAGAPGARSSSKKEQGSKRRRVSAGAVAFTEFQLHFVVFHCCEYVGEAAWCLLE